MFGLNLKTMAVAAAVALTVGFGSGVWVRGSFCDAAAQRSRADSLQLQLNATKKAMERDQAKAAEDRRARDILEGAIREIEDQISTGECLSSDDVGRLRQLWK